MTTESHGTGSELMRRGHEAFNDRDRDTLMSLIAEDVRWHGPLAGSIQGRDALWEQFFAPMWEAPVHLDDHDFLDNDDHAVALSDLIFDLPDGPRTWKVVEVAHHEDGRLTERWAFVEDEQGFLAFVDQLRQAAG